MVGQKTSCIVIESMSIDLGWKVGLIAEWYVNLRRSPQPRPDDLLRWASYINK